MIPAPREIGDGSKERREERVMVSPSSFRGLEDETLQEN